MSRESLLDDAIAKAKEAEDWQLVEWLRMARGGESAARWYMEKLRDANRTIRKLLDENARLRSCLSDDAENARMIIAENNKLRELVDYMTPIAWYAASERERDRMRDLGVEVDA